MSLFPSLKVTEDTKNNNLDKPLQGSLFHSIEYELNGILKKIQDINNLNDKEIHDIIIRQYPMILNYDLFLQDNTTREQALMLFTNKRFLNCFISVIRLLELNNHQKVCLNKIAYDYYILPNNDPIVAELLYRLTTEVNTKEVTILSGMIGLRNAQILTMIRNSTFKEEKAVHRVNTFIIRSNLNIDVKQVVSIYCCLFERFTNVFIYTMLEPKLNELTTEQYVRFDTMSMAIIEMLDSLPSHDIEKVLMDYAFTIQMAKVSRVRFSIKTIQSKPRIITALKIVEAETGLVIP